MPGGKSRAIQSKKEKLVKNVEKRYESARKMVSTEKSNLTSHIALNEASGMILAQGSNYSLASSIDS